MSEYRLRSNQIRRKTSSLTSSTQSRSAESAIHGESCSQVQARPCSESPIKRFNEKYRVKGHLSAGAHGIILWAVEQPVEMHEVALVQQRDHPNGVQHNCQLHNLVKIDEGPPDWPAATSSTESALQNPLHRQLAIKRIFIRNRVVPVSVIREIKSLQFLSGHDNVGKGYSIAERN